MTQYTGYVITCQLDAKTIQSNQQAQMDYLVHDCSALLAMCVLSYPGQMIVGTFGELVRLWVTFGLKIYISGDISINKYKEGTCIDQPQELNLELKHRSTNNNIMAYKQ